VEIITEENSFSDQLRDSADQTGTIICMGYDPAPLNFGDLYGEMDISGYDDQLPEPGTDINMAEAAEVFGYLKETAAVLEEEGIEVSGARPNTGYFEMDGRNGKMALDGCIDLFSDLPSPTILDAKISDIGRSMAARTEATLERPTAKEGVDAVTVNPLMGHDSIEPAARKAHENNEGIYVLTRTTNSGAEDFLTREIEGEKEKGDGKCRVEGKEEKGE
jgi:orotidine-5'-phosphate decarboxylase